jgi:hypothetical protein
MWRSSNLEDESIRRLVRRVFKSREKSHGSIVKRHRRIYMHVVMHRRLVDINAS